MSGNNSNRKENGTCNWTVEDILMSFYRDQTLWRNINYRSETQIISRGTPRSPLTIPLLTDCNPLKETFPNQNFIDRQSISDTSTEVKKISLITCSQMDRYVENSGKVRVSTVKRKSKNPKFVDAVKKFLLKYESKSLYSKTSEKTLTTELPNDAIKTSQEVSHEVSRKKSQENINKKKKALKSSDLKRCQSSVNEGASTSAINFRQRAKEKRNSTASILDVPNAREISSDSFPEKISKRENPKTYITILPKPNNILGSHHEETDVPFIQNINIPSMPSAHELFLPSDPGSFRPNSDIITINANGSIISNSDRFLMVNADRSSIPIVDRSFMPNVNHLLLINSNRSFMPNTSGSFLPNVNGSFFLNADGSFIQRSDNRYSMPNVNSQIISNDNESTSVNNCLCQNCLPLTSGASNYNFWQTVRPCPRKLNMFSTARENFPVSTASINHQQSFTPALHVPFHRSYVNGSMSTTLRNTSRICGICDCSHASSTHTRSNLNRNLSSKNIQSPGNINLATTYGWPPNCPCNYGYNSISSNQICPQIERLPTSLRGVPGPYREPPTHRNLPRIALNAKRGRKIRKQR